MRLSLESFIRRTRYTAGANTKNASANSTNGRTISAIIQVIEANDVL